MMMALNLQNLKFDWQIIFILITLVINVSTEDKFYHLQEFPGPQGKNVVITPDGEQKVTVLCYPGQDRRWYRFWTCPKLTLKSAETPDASFKVYYGDNETEVLERAQASIYLPWPSLPWAKDQFTFYPFNKSCIGIVTEQHHKAHFDVKNPHYVYILMAVVGCALFIFARAWSGNVALHYGVGMSVGVVGSILIMFFILTKFLPSRLKTVTIAIGAVSTSLSFWLYHHISSYLQDIVTNNWKVLCGYVLISALVSFAVVYRYGPMSDQRSLNLVKWTLQAIGLILLYHSSQIPEVSIAAIMLLIAVYNLPRGLVPALGKMKYKLFPPKRRLLTEEEYELEGEVETKKALEDLRNFCSSPNCNTWRTVSRLASPGKFAKFVEGDSHVSNSEFESYMEDCNVGDSGDAAQFEEEFEEEEYEDDCMMNSTPNGSINNSKSFSWRNVIPKHS